MRSIRKITFKPRWQTNLSVVLVSEWWVNTPITELGDIARHSARWRGINRNLLFFFFFVPCITAPLTLIFFFRRQKGAVYTPLIIIYRGVEVRYWGLVDEWFDYEPHCMGSNPCHSPNVLWQGTNQYCCNSLCRWCIFKSLSRVRNSLNAWAAGLKWG